MSMSSTDKGLLTPGNCAVIFIDHQPQMFLGAANTDWEELLKNVLVLARAAKLFGVPVILTAVESGEFDGEDRAAIARSVSRPATHSTFQHERVGRRGIRGRGQEHRAQELPYGGLWSEACLAFPALQMLEEGYGVYVVKDASRGTNQAAQDTALRRVEQAGGVSVTALQVLLEFQRDWARAEHYDEVTAIVKERCRGYSPGAERPARKVHHAPAAPTQTKPTNNETKGNQRMNTITTKDGTQIYYKDWGTGQPIVFSHGWPLSADDWDTQMLFFLDTAIASSPTTGAAMAAPPRPMAGMIWITTPTTWRR